ncbi:hypothetical protein F5144DRAFT_586947 [Chaetomium tenue]|uniref:Uncharacterized protein n=1 Tax=Chaetomium tenue TaxID=1854479 RepID=A0ACB7NY06_9PEZI|nr:hypothetical protein F5144DRAFT_586947 [Chaetomium globosum]
MRMAHGNGGGMPASEYLLWVHVMDPGAKGELFGHRSWPKSQRRHPGSAEKKSDVWWLWQLSEKPEYRGGLGVCWVSGCIGHMLTCGWGLKKELVYTYDFGSNFEHSFIIMDRAEVTKHFVCPLGTGLVVPSVRMLVVFRGGMRRLPTALNNRPKPGGAVVSSTRLAP